MRITEQVKETIEHYNLLKKGDKVIIGVSGGPDSVALVLILNELRYDIGLSIHLAHLNHKLRREAKGDQEFVKKLALSLKFPLSTKTVDVKKYKKGDSLEEKAREARLKFFEQIAKKNKADVIALGHTQDDVSETALMRIIRGSGLSGLRAILPMRKIGKIKIIRPLINTSKKDLKKYLKLRHQDFRVDKSNLKADFFRNKIRLKLIPDIERSYNKQVRKALSNLAKTIADDYNYLENLADRNFAKLTNNKKDAKSIRFSLADLKKHHPSMQRMLIRKAIKKLKGSTNRITFSHMKDIESLISRKTDGISVDLPNNIKVSKNKEYITFSRRNS